MKKFIQILVLCMIALVPRVTIAQTMEDSYSEYLLKKYFDSIVGSDTMTSSRVNIWEDTKDWATFDSLYKKLLLKFSDSLVIYKKRNIATKKIEEFQIERYGDTLYFIQIKPYFNSQLKLLLSNTTYIVEEIFPKNAGEHFMPGDDYISRIELIQFFRDILTEENKPKSSRK